MRRALITTAIILFCISATNIVFAQETDSIALTLTPPLVKVNLNPGETWSSSIKIVNNNEVPITVYTQTLDFKSGENGGVVFIKKQEIEELAKEEKRFLLSHWLEIDSSPINIPAQESIEIPFTINVPESGEPGGHYAAVLAGTQPEETIREGTTLNISSLLASLILLNVKGEVIEQGQIREFSTDKKFYQKPEVEFTVRFQNIGNIHLQPQGDITIYDMFENEQDRITINHASEFGNVLPKSIRKWNFSWEGDRSLLKTGRYRALLVLGFGDKARETVDQTLYFWNINFIILASLLGGVILIIVFTVFLIRRYIRRAVTATQQAAGMVVPTQPAGKSKTSIIPANNNLVDLSARVKTKTEAQVPAKKKRKGWSALRRYIVLAMVGVVIALGTIIYFSSREIVVAPVPSESDNPPVSVTAPIDEPKSEEDKVLEPTEEIATTTNDQGEAKKTEDEEVVIEKTEDEPKIDNSISIKILNGSGAPGVASRAAEPLKDKGYENISLGNAQAFNYSSTIISYKLINEGEAEKISEVFANVVDLQVVESQEEDIIIIIGNDFK